MTEALNRETPTRADLRLLTKHFLALLAARAPGRSVEVRVLPRSTQAADLVDAVVKENPWVESDARYIKKAVVKG